MMLSVEFGLKLGESLSDLSCRYQHELEYQQHAPSVWGGSCSGHRHYGYVPGTYEGQNPHICAPDMGSNTLKCI